MPGPASHGPHRYIGFINTEANNVQYMLAFDVGLRFSFFFQSFFFIYHGTVIDYQAIFNLVSCKTERGKELI